MAVTSVVSPQAEYQWLSTDRLKNVPEYQVLAQTCKNGHLGRELDTGRQFWFSEELRQFVEYKLPMQIALETLLTAVAAEREEVAALLRQIRFGLAALSDEDLEKV